MEGVKKNPTQIWPHLCQILFNSFPNTSPNSVFSFYLIQIVKENVCNTLELVRVDLLGSLELVRVDLLGSWTRQVGDFQDDCAGVRHWVILLAPRRVRQTIYFNRSWDKRSENINVRPKLGLRHQRKKERKWNCGRHNLPHDSEQWGKQTYYGPKVNLWLNEFFNSFIFSLIN